MKFGRVDHPEQIDFKLPEDHPETKVVLQGAKACRRPEIFVGCAKWNRQDLRNFYPPGIQNELKYYASQFNSVELNATFYRVFPEGQYKKWVASVPEDFRFFPKVLQNVSHLRRLNERCYTALDRFLHTLDLFGDHLGSCFIQLHPNFGPKDWDRVDRFIEYWPGNFPLALEVRHPGWFMESEVTERLFHTLRTRGMNPVITDTAGRRDVLHMRLTSPEAFIRFVASNHETDFHRLDDWILRIAGWIDQGLESVQFFIHQKMDGKTPFLATYFIERLNQHLEHPLHIPKTLNREKRKACRAS